MAYRVRLRFDDMMKYFKPLFGIVLQVLALALIGAVGQAQSGDLVYIDSVVSGPGQDVTVGFGMKNTDSIASLSIPIWYDTSVLSLKSLTFAGTRISYLGNKLTTPQTITQANGHFVVAAFRMLEPAVAPGEGPVFKVTFTISSKATSGTSSKIDSLFYPPGGELLLVEAVTARTIRPDFTAGKVSVSTRPPVFSALADQTVIEGDTLKLDIVASDPNGQKITLSLITKPTGATLTDNGNGTGRVIWVPDFIGPNSSDMSPFTIAARATNGTASTDISVHVTVINRDRAPVISVASSLQVQAGQPLSFVVSATDADFDPVTWSLAGLPTGAVYDYKNPGRVDWTPALTDSGSRTINFVAADPNGFSDTATVVINVAKTVIYSLTLDTLSADPNATVDYFVSLDNKLPISSFDLLFNYDPSVLTLISYTNAGTRSAGLGQFAVTTNAGGIAGNVRIVGNVNGQSQTGNPPMGAATGAIAKLTFKISGNISYAGQYLPMRFQFLDSPANDDNTMTDSIGVKITQGQISYRDGAIQVKSLGTVKLGDINLNGLAYEISDVIYFTNFFIDPIRYPFNALQYANSDVNGDHYVATVADLITLINVVLGGTPSPRITGAEPNAVELELAARDGGVVVQSTSTEPVAGLLMTLKAGPNFDQSQIRPLSSQLTAIMRQDGDSIRLLLYGLHGGSLASGTNDLIEINSAEKVEITGVSAASSDGQLMTASVGERLVLPEKFSLEQNYPNPFNPETKINFALPTAGTIRLVVYNVLGEAIATLADGSYAAGTYSVTWRGVDQSGRSVASGIYLYRLESSANTVTRKMMLVK